MPDKPRLIERAFCLKQASLDAVHEKNVRHGHISTLHIWPARRPLAACRAALIATLLPDPGTGGERRRILEMLGGRVEEKIEKKKRPDGRVAERIKEVTKGGILHWGRENDPALDWFRAEIKKAYGGRAPKVLDPFAGGGAIPLEAMRLGCAVTAADINPVAWFILKCTLEYPQKLAGQKMPLPEFVKDDPGFVKQYCKAHPGFCQGESKKQLQFPFVTGKDGMPRPPAADLAWHVRAWGRWVLQNARRELARFYPTYADFEPLQAGGAACERRDSRRVPLKEDGTPDMESLNGEFHPEYLRDRRNPRWVAKPTVAYLWARTVQCKNCRATVPLLKTRWLCKKAGKRVALTMAPQANGTGVVFGIDDDVSVVGKTAAERRAYDARIGSGTMSRSGAACPCCKAATMTMEDIRLEGRAGRLGAQMTAVVVNGPRGKEYRLPTADEIRLAREAGAELEKVYAEIPFGLPEEPTPEGGSGASRAFSVDGYGFDTWAKLFNARQMLFIGSITKHIRGLSISDQLMDPIWFEAIRAYLACITSRTADYLTGLCIWENGAEEVKHTFMRWALPIVWDFAEGNPMVPLSRFFTGAVHSCSLVISKTMEATCPGTKKPKVFNRSALKTINGHTDIIITDPPYYDAIPYSDLMDFFHVFLRRTLHGLSPEIDTAFRKPLAPKWNHEKNDGELIDDSSRHKGDKAKSKAVYEEGMYRAFRACYQTLTADGRMVIVFAHKQPDAWETLVSALIGAGFCVTGSWPIVTEMTGGLRNLNRAALASSVWLVCRKRPDTARLGWDNQVLAEMREGIHTRLHEYWDAGIRGPDFVWAATGPALETYSKHPVVKKANEPQQIMDVSEFLRAVRRIVVDFVVGRVLPSNGGAGATEGLDDVSAYYLLHRHDFGMDSAPVGACILYAVSCGLLDRDLFDRYDILARVGGSGTGGKARLKSWHLRRKKNLGRECDGRPVPLIDRVHHLMHLWKAGDVALVDDFLDGCALRRNRLFHRLLQALIELAPAGNGERSLLESISNHVAAGGVSPPREGLFETNNTGV